MTKAIILFIALPIIMPIPIKTKPIKPKALPAKLTELAEAYKAAAIPIPACPKLAASPVPAISPDHATLITAEVKASITPICFTGLQP